MKRQLFLFHAKRGHGECISELKKGDIYQYECQVEKVFLNNYAFLKKDESRSSYAYEMIRYFHEDYYFKFLICTELVLNGLVSTFFRHNIPKSHLFWCRN